MNFSILPVEKKHLLHGYRWNSATVEEYQLRQQCSAIERRVLNFEDSPLLLVIGIEHVLLYTFKDISLMFFGHVDVVPSNFVGNTSWSCKTVWQMLPMPSWADYLLCKL